MIQFSLKINGRIAIGLMTESAQIDSNIYINMENIISNRQSKKKNISQFWEEFSAYVKRIFTPKISELEKLQRRNLELEVQIENERRRVTILKEKSTHDRETIIEKDDSIQKLKASKEVLEIKIKNKDEQIAELESEIEEKDEIIDDLEKEKANLENEISRLRIEVETVYLQFNSLREQLSNENQELRSILEERNQEIQDLRDQIQNIAENTISTPRFIELEERNRINEATILGLRNTIHQFIQQYGIEVIGLRNSLNQSQSDYFDHTANLHQQIIDLNIQDDELRNCVHELNSSVAGSAQDYLDHTRVLQQEIISANIKDAVNNDRIKNLQDELDDEIVVIPMYPTPTKK